MTSPQNNHGRPNDCRTRIALAALTGLLAGAARAVASWLIDRIASSH